MEVNIDNNKRIAKNTIFLYIRMLLIMVVSLYTSRINLKSLGIVDFGIYNIVAGLTAMFTFLNGSLGIATSRFITFELGRNDYESLNKTFNVALVVHILMAVFIVLLCETIGLWYFYNKMIIPEDRVYSAMIIYQISVLGLPLFLSQAPYNAVIIAHENMKIYAYYGIVDVFARLLISFLLFITPFDKLITFSVLIFLEALASLIFFRLYCIKHYPETKISFCFDLYRYKKMLVYAASDLIGQLAGLAQGQGLNLLLNSFFGPVVNAARGIAYQVQGSVVKFSSSFMTAAKPQIIKYYAQGDIDSMMRLVVRSACFSFYLLLFIAMPICLEADMILKLWLGEYPEHTVSFLILIILWCLVNTWKESRGAALHATGHLFLSNVTVSIMVCMAFPLGYIFLKNGGSPETVFVAGLITIFLSDLIGIAVLRKYIKFNVCSYILNVHVRCIVVLIISLLLPYFVYNKIMAPCFLRIIVTGMITSISIIFTCYIIGMDRYMRNKTYEYIKNIIKK